MSDRRTRRGFHLQRVQATLSAAKLGPRVGAVRKRPVPAESASALIDERSTNLGTGAGRPRESARNYTHLGAVSPTELDSRRSPPPCDGPFHVRSCWTTGAGPVVDSTVRAPRG